eukprot:jgi/Botrbrau1/12400/Bobra.0084s0021.2
MFSYPDRLHQCSLGILKMLLDLLRIMLSKAELQRVNEEVCLAPKFPTCRRPSAGLLAPKFEGKEVYYTMIYVPISLLALQSSRAARDMTVLNLLEAIIEYQEWCKVRDLDVHTDATIAVLEGKRQRFQSFVLKHFSEQFNWLRPKFAEMAAYPAAIRALGNVLYSDTSTGEAMHKEQKQFSAFQNNHATAVSQVTLKRNRMTAAIYIQSCDTSLLSRTRVTTADKAEESQTVLLHAIGQQYPCTAVGFSELLTAQPHLKLDEAGEQLLDCIKLIIRELDSSLEDDILEKSQICVAGSVAMPCRFHRGAGLQAQYVKIPSSEGQFPTMTIKDVISLVHLRRYRECSGRRNRYHERLRMPRLVWETSGSRGRRRPVYQCVQLGTINNLVIMQRDPTPHSEEAFFCNTLVPMHYVQ